MIMVILTRRGIIMASSWHQALQKFAEKIALKKTKFALKLANFQENRRNSRNIF